MYQTYSYTTTYQSNMCTATKGLPPLISCDQLGETFAIHLLPISAVCNLCKCNLYKCNLCKYNLCKCKCSNASVQLVLSHNLSRFCTHPCISLSNEADTLTNECIAIYVHCTCLYSFSEMQIDDNRHCASQKWLHQFLTSIAVSFLHQDCQKV